MPLLDGLNECSGDIVDAAMRVHTFLGCRVLESTYETCLAIELRRRGHLVESQVGIPLTYEGVTIEAAYRADMIVDRRVMLELKAVSKLHPVHSTQLLSYLRLSGLPLGLLINFHEPLLKHGIKRLVNGMREG